MACFAQEATHRKVDIHKNILHGQGLTTLFSDFQRIITLWSF